MTGMTDYVSDAVLNHVTGTKQIFARPSVYLALFNAVGLDDGTGFTEVSGGAYARQQLAGGVATNGATAGGNNTLNFASTPAWILPGMFITDETTGGVIPGGTTVLSTTGTTVVMSANASGGGVLNGDTIVFSAWNLASGSAPSMISNNIDISFPQATTDWGTVLGWGLFDDPTAGHLLSWDYLGSFDWMPCTVTADSPATVTSPAHSMVAGNSFVFNTEYGGTAPVFSASNFTGILTVTAPVTADDFTVTNGVTAVNTSASGDGLIRRVTPQAIPSGITATFVGGVPGVLALLGA